MDQCNHRLEIIQSAEYIVELHCQLQAGHTCPHRHNAPRDDDAGRFVVLWEGDENHESLDEWEDRLPPSLDELLSGRA
jgi:hypothetical protein